MKMTFKMTLALMALMAMSACSSPDDDVFSDYDYDASYDTTSNGYPLTDLLHR